VERNQSPTPIRIGELSALVDRQIIGCPVSWEENGGRPLVSTRADRPAAVTTILRREYQLLLQAIEIALRPAVVSAAFQQEDFLSGKIMSDFFIVQFRIVLQELIATVLGYE
jgi:hypothetical protein